MEEFQSYVWRCPACNTDENSKGEPLMGSRAVALHVAGKIRGGDSTHRKWAVNLIGDRIWRPEIYGSINTLADELKAYIVAANTERIELEQKRIQRAIEERVANREPEVVAYTYVRAIETSLHECVRRTLQEAYGDDEENWWVKGVPQPIRVDCARKREESSEREALYSYTNLIHLKDIIEKNRKLFEQRLAAIGRRGDQQKEFLDGIARSNGIRNRVMHTVRTITGDDVSFLRKFCDRVELFVQ